MSRRSIFSSATYSGRIMNGRKLYVSPKMTDAGVARKWNAGSSRPRSFSVPNTSPLSDRIIRQLSVRITKLTKNGRMTMNSSAVFSRPPWKAIVYAIG